MEKYSLLLKQLGVEAHILADLDYGVDLVPSLGDLTEKKWAKIDVDVLKNQKSKDRRKLSEALQKAI